jgi:hypothetical protein
MAVAPGPAPSDQARPIVSAITRSNWRICPNVNERKNVPSVEGAMTRNGNTIWVDPAPQHVGVVDVRPARQDRGDQGEHLAARSRPTRGCQSDGGINQGLEPEMNHQGGRNDQSGVSHQSRVVKGHLDPLDCARYFTH